MTFPALTLVVALSGVSLSAADLPLQPGTAIRFATVDAGKTLLTTRDAFVAALSPFDRAARLMTDHSVSEDEYLHYVGRHVLAWETHEVSKLSAIFNSLRSKLTRWDLPLPETILLVKTTGREEGGAAYTRANAIVLPRRHLDRTAGQLEKTLLHELFHVLSRRDESLRESLYGIIGFRPCGDIVMPGSLAARKITNPDSVGVDYAIRVTQNGAAYNAVPVLFSSVGRTEPGRPFFAYLTFRLMAVEQQGDHWGPKLVDDQPKLFKHTEVSGFYEQVGRNTEYVIHPEEILADNFVLLIKGKRNVPTPKVVEEMAQLLGKP